MNQTLISAVVCLLLSLGTVGQSVAPTQKPAVSGSTEKAVEKLIDEYTEAAKKGDTDFLEKNLAREYIGIEADGHLSTKAEILDLYRSGQVKFEALEVKDRKARVYGNIAVVISEMAIKGHSGGAELNGTYRSTRVLQRSPDRNWRLVNSQLTKVQ